MKDAVTIIEENRNIYQPNAGVKGLARKAEQDPDFCIMDNDEDHESYRSQCPDSGRCSIPSYMLACLQSRRVDMLGNTAIRIYNQFE